MSTTFVSTAAEIPNVHLSASARQSLEDLVREHGPHVLVLRSECAAPTVVRVMPQRGFRPAADERLLTVLSGHPLWADETALRRCPHHFLVLDTTTVSGGALHLIARPDDPTGARRAS